MERRIIDLTYPIHEGMTTFPTHWHPFVEISQLGRHGIENRETRKLVLGTHTGTHVDAPRHFIPGGATIDQVPLEVLVGPAEVIDFSHCTALQEFGVEDFKRQLGDRNPKRLIVRFDWSKYWGDMRYYTEQPYLSEAACEWLVSRGCKLLALDIAMPDNPKHGRGCEKDSPNHKILLGNSCIIVEYLCNLQEIKKKEVELFVLPLKIAGADGSPARCIAIESY